MPENQATHIHTSAEYESCEECKSRATRETRDTPPERCMKVIYQASAGPAKEDAGLQKKHGH